MGVSLKPTATMVPWWVIVHTDYARLTCAPDFGTGDDAAGRCTCGCVPDQRHLGEDLVEPGLDECVVEEDFCFPQQDRIALIAALDQVLACPIYVDYYEQHSLQLGAWATPQVEHGQVRVRGPLIAPDTRNEQTQDDLSVEIRYENIAELRIMLNLIDLRTGREDP